MVMTNWQLDETSSVRRFRNLVWRFQANVVCAEISGYRAKIARKRGFVWRFECPCGDRGKRVCLHGFVPVFFYVRDFLSKYDEQIKLRNVHHVVDLDVMCLWLSCCSNNTSNVVNVLICFIFGQRHQLFGDR